MNYYSIEFKKKALKELKNFPKEIIKAINNKISSLIENPLPYGVMKISGAQSLFRIRAGDYRIIYHVDKNQNLITILYIRHRKDVYRLMK